MMFTFLLLSLGLAALGFAQLSLAMARHHRDVFGAPPPPSTWPWRVAGFACLMLALAPCAWALPLPVAIVVWLGMLTVAAFLIVALLSYRPGVLRWMRYFAGPHRPTKARD